MGMSIKMIDLQLKNKPELRLSAEIRSGEKIGLTGINGAGKTTLLRYLACLIRPYAMGQLLIDGKDPFHANDMEKLRGQTGYLMQEPEQGVVFSGVSQDAIFGPENLAVEPEVIRKRWKGLAGKLLYEDKKLSRDEVKKQGALSDRNYRTLSGGQKQRAALASVLMMRASLLLLDEPFSMLGRQETEEILSFLTGMSKRLEQTMIIVSHDQDILRKMDRVFVLDEKGINEICYKKGQWKYKTDGSEYEALQQNATSAEPGIRGSSEEIDAKTSGPVLKEEKSLLQIPPLRERQEEAEKGEVSEKEAFINPKLIRIEGVDTVEVYSPVIAFSDVCFQYGNEQIIKNFSASVYPGIYYELAGGTGCGKTTLCKLTNATLLADSGMINVKGLKLPLKGASGRGRASKEAGASGVLRTVRQIVGYVMQHPEDQLFAPSVLEDVMYGPLKYGKTKEAAGKDAEDALSLLGISPALWKKQPEKLSAGEKRRVAIAGVLALKPEIFILDEPFAGLDSEGTELLREVLKEYVRMGRTVIVTVHERYDR